MYCPGCGTQNNDDAKYCRVCGANLSLISQALTGKPAYDVQYRHEKGRHRHRRPPSIEQSIRSIFMGLGFILVSFAALFFAPAGRLWWFWMLIPAFTMLGKGVADLVSLKWGQNQLPGITSQPPLQSQISQAPPRNPYEALPPPSIVENTTRHLDPASKDPRERQ